jgi:hypothetical protein
MPRKKSNTTFESTYVTVRPSSIIISVYRLTTTGVLEGCKSKFIGSQYVVFVALEETASNMAEFSEFGAKNKKRCASKRAMTL